MLCSVKGRYEYGYAIEGKDEVPGRPQGGRWLPLYEDESYFYKGKIEASLAKIVGLLKDANRRADQWKDDYQSLLRKYNKLYQDYMDLNTVIFAVCVNCYQMPHRPARPSHRAIPAVKGNRPWKVSEKS